MAQNIEQTPHRGALHEEQATENSPLLIRDHVIQPHLTTSSSSSSSSPPSLKSPTRPRRRIIILLCAFAFTMMLGDNLQPAALTQIFEQVICEDYYHTYDATSKRPPLLTSFPKREDGDRCKIAPVQEELALVRGYQQLVPLFAALLCTVPYGLLAERIGRKRVLVMAGTGVFASFSWILLVCYYRFLPIRWITFAGVFLFIGGGDAVVTSTVHIMVTDVAEEGDRAQIFLYLHAADVVSGFFGPTVSAGLMDKGWAWSVLILSDFSLFAGTYVITQFIPETLHMRKPSLPIHQREDTANATDPPAPSSPSIPMSILKIMRNSASSVLAPFLNIFRSNRQAILLLCIFSPQTSARELFTVIGLQYSNARYSLSYARGNLLLSIFQAVQGLVVLVFIPAITRLVADRQNWSSWSRDRLYAVASMAIMSLGLLVIGTAPGVFIEAMGLLLVALSSCTTGLLMSLLGGAVLPNQVAAMYGTAHMLSIIARSITGLVASELLVEGMKLGHQWMGLPFIAMAMLLASLFVLGRYISKEKPVA